MVLQYNTFHKIKPRRKKKKKKKHRSPLVRSCHLLSRNLHNNYVFTLDYTIIKYEDQETQPPNLALGESGNTSNWSSGSPFSNSLG